MKNKKKNFSAGLNVGSSSILVTFVLLCLVTFASLSFVSANADLELARQTADRVTAYYSSDSIAEINLANIDSLLSKHAKNCSEEDYYDTIEQLFSDNNDYEIITTEDNTFVHYVVPVSNIQDLSVTLKILYPSHPTADTFIITEWENVSTYIGEETTLNEEKGGLLF